MTIVLLLRHGEIPQCHPRKFVGQRDLALTDLGRRQASRWASALAGLPLDGAWCSTLSRCRETAELALAELPRQAVPVEGLREISMGRWEGLSEDEVRRQFPGEFERRGADLANVAPEGGESFAQLQHRAWESLACILAHADSRQVGGGREAMVLVVAHAGINRALICRALHLPLERVFSLGQDYAGLSILRFTANHAPQLCALNLPPLPAGTLANLLPKPRGLR